MTMMRIYQLLLFLLFFLQLAAASCPVMLMRFDATGCLWIAMAVGEEGPLQLPTIKGECRTGIISYYHRFRDVLVAPIKEEVVRHEKQDDEEDENGSDEESEMEGMLVVLDSKQANGSNDFPSFVEGDMIWVAPSSTLLDDLFIDEAARNMLAGLQGLNKAIFQSGFEETKPKITKKTSPMTVKALPSLGSTSYFNCALQILFRVSLFREFIKEAPQTFPYLAKDSFTLKLERLFREMEKPGEIHEGIPKVLLEDLLLALQAHTTDVVLLEENEPEEAISVILEAIAAETSASPWILRSPVLQLGQVKLKEVDSCDCGLRDITTPSIQYIFELVVTDQSADLERLIEGFLQPKVLFAKGHESHHNQRELSIQSLPPILIFHLTRADDHALVHFPAEGLDMSRHLDNYSGPALIYDFVAASIPSEGPQPFTTGLMFPDCWYEIADDHHGNRFSFDFRHKAIGETASLLVYQLRSSIGKENHVFPESFNRNKTKSSESSIAYRRDTVWPSSYSGSYFGESFKDFDMPVGGESLSSPKLLIKGLPNLGATCYLNSALQLLFHMPLFREFIKEAPRAFPEVQKNSITAQLANLFSGMEKTDDSRIGSEVMRKLVLSLQPHNQNVNLLGQNDPEEAITTIFDAVAAETKAASSLLTATQLGQVKLTEVDHCSCGQRDMETPLLQYSFKLENLRVNQPHELEKLMAESLQSKPLEGVEGHEEHLNLRQLHIRSLPPLLIFHVNRWTRGGGKNQAEVRFPSVLDMAPHIPGYIGLPLLYDFAGASLHSGDLRAGHYTTGLILKDGGWYEISDDHYGNSYDLADRRQSVGKNAVLLVYQQRPPGIC